MLSRALKYQFKKAFTMLEVIFVIVVAGILAAIILPNTRTDPIYEATNQLLSHIRYTQHLAMVDDKYDTNRIDLGGSVIWYKDRWQLVFANSQFTDNEVAYTIYSDTQGRAVGRGDPNESEVALNPQNPDQLMTGGHTAAAALDYTNAGFRGMKKLNLGKSYGVQSVRLTGGCQNSRISFDHLGRPFTGDQSTMVNPYNAGGTQRLITANCDVNVSGTDRSIIIRIAPETGYACILDGSGSCI